MNKGVMSILSKDWCQRSCMTLGECHHWDQAGQAGEELYIDA